jgi:hypothetical protein
MTETTASAVDHDANLILAIDSHLASSRFVENLLHHLHGSATHQSLETRWPWILGCRRAMPEGWESYSGRRCGISCQQDTHDGTMGCEGTRQRPSA